MLLTQPIKPITMAKVQKSVITYQILIVLKFQGYSYS